LTDYLLDTSFISAFAPDRPQLTLGVRKWIAEQRELGSWQLSSIVVLELENGIAKLRLRGAHAKAGRISVWFERLLNEFDQRILPVDVAIAREAGRLEEAVVAKGFSPGLADVLIAATARLNGLAVLTANIRHFAMLDVPHMNPFAEIGPEA